MLVGAATMVGSLALLVVATWFLARRFCGAPWALLAAGVAGTLPGVLALAGVYYFAVPAAALFTLGLACMARADGGARWGWMVAAGLALGLAALARTMVVGLVPAAAAVAVAAALWPGPDRARRLAGTAAGGAAGAAVALAWYAGNSGRVVDYLRADQVATGGGGGGQAWAVPGHAGPAAVGVGSAGADRAGAGGRRRGGRGAASWRRRRGRRRRGGPAGVPGDLGLAGPAAVVVLGAGVLVVASQAVGQWLPLVPALVVSRWPGRRGAARRRPDGGGGRAVRPRPVPRSRRCRGSPPR